MQIGNLSRNIIYFEIIHCLPDEGKCLKKGVIVLYISKKLFIYIATLFIFYNTMCVPTLILERVKSFTSVTDNDVRLCGSGW